MASQARNIKGDQTRPSIRLKRPEPLAAAHYAALDLGSNNCRLLIAKPNANSFKVVDAFSRAVRLGEGVEAQGRLCDAAMDRALAALRVCARKLSHRGVGRLRAVATEACRRADNAGFFAEHVFRETGLQIDIISAQEEGRLALMACAALLDERPRALIFDIGGGSTEIGWVEIMPGEKPRSIDCMSIPMGVLTLTERFRNTPDRRARLHAMSEAVFQALLPFEARHNVAGHIANDAVQMIGTSGTVTTFCGIALGLERYERNKVDGSLLRFDDADRVTALLLRMPGDQRRNHPCIGRQRSDLMDAGCAIFDAIRRLWPLHALRVADRGLREGILIDLMQADGVVIDRGPTRPYAAISQHHRFPIG